MSDDAGYVPLGSLKPGDLFERQDGKLYIVSDLERKTAIVWVLRHTDGGLSTLGTDILVRPLVAVYRHPQLSPDLWDLMTGLAADPENIQRIAALADRLTEITGVQGDAARLMQEAYISALIPWPHKLFTQAI